MLIIRGKKYLKKEFGGLPAKLKAITFPLYQDTATKLYYKSPEALWRGIKNVQKTIVLTLVQSNWMIPVCVACVSFFSPIAFVCNLNLNVIFKGCEVLAD